MLNKLYENISSELLTDDIKLQLNVLFESTVNEAIAAKEKALEEQNAEEVAKFKESLTDQIGEYLDYFVEEFVQENEEIIDESVKINTATKIIKSFDSIVENFNVSISEETVAQDTMVEELTEEINKLHNKIMDLKKENQLIIKASCISEAQLKLDTDVEKDKLIKLSETVEFDETFDKKLNIFVEQIISARIKVPAATLDEDNSHGSHQEPKEKKSTLVEQCLSYL